MKEKIKKYLKWSQKYAKTDMVYVAKNSFWITLNKILLAAISIVTMIAFANWLPQEDFGKYQLVVSIIGIVSIISLPGMSSALVRSIAKKKEGSLIEAFKARIKWGNFGSFIIVIIASWYFINENIILGWVLIVSALFFPLRNASSLFPYYWNGKKRFDIETKYKVISSTISALITITTLYLTNNIILVILAFFGGQSLTDYFFYLLSKRNINKKEVDPGMIPYGKTLTIISSIGRIAKHIDKIILWKFLGPVQVAIYSFSILPIDRIKGIIPISKLALPKLSEKENDKKRKAGILDKFWRLFLIMIPITILAIFIAPIGYKLIFPQYMDSVIYAQFLSLILLTSPFSLLGTFLIAEMKKKELYVIKFIVPIIQIIILLILVPLYGILGAVIAIIFSRFLQAIMQFYYFKKLI